MADGDSLASKGTVVIAADDRRWEALVDDAVHEINMRWGVPLDDSDEPDTEPLDQAMVRETAAAILRPIEDEVEALREALELIAQHAALDNVERGVKEAERYEVIACDALERTDPARRKATPDG